MDYLSEAVLDALIDALKLLPFLYLTYLFMELIEHRTSEHATLAIGKAGRLGALFGGLLGAVPQCGFSAAAAGLFSGRVITLGTLIAVFLSTSDEMVAVMLSGAVDNPDMIPKLLTVLGIKVVCGILVGFAVDLIILHRHGPKEHSHEIGSICEHEHCNCEKHSVFLSALLHTLQIWVFLFAITLAINTVVFFVGEETLGSALRNVPIVGELISGLVGLIPNCVSSVIITELYVDGVITAGQMLSGLFTSAGVGLLVLFRSNRNLKENLVILLTLYVSGVLLGILIGQTGLAALIGL